MSEAANGGKTASAPAARISGAFSAAPTTKAMVTLLVRNEATMPTASIASPTIQ